MMLLDKEMTNGVKALYHRVEKFEMRPEVNHAIVSSYHDPAMVQISWQDTYTIPTFVLINGFADLERLLTAPGGPFEGATVVADEVSDLDSAKARKRALLKVERDRAEWAGVDTPAGRVDSDPTAQRKVSGSVTMAMIAAAAGQPFTMVWTMADNSEVSFDGDTMISVGLAVGQHVAACQARKKVLEAEIDAAADEEALAAVEIDTGWPA